MKQKHLITAAFAALTLSAQSAVITWESSARPIITAADIINDGAAASNITFGSTLAPGGAFNFGPAVTINGVSFAGAGGSGPYGAPTGDANLDLLYLYHDAVDGPGPWVLSMSGLLPETEYKIQIIGINDIRDGISDRTTQYTDETAGSLSPVLTRGTGGSVIGTFTTGAGETSFDIWGEGLGSTDPGAAGVVLRVIPEPSAAALLGLGSLALILRRRK